MGERLAPMPTCKSRPFASGELIRRCRSCGRRLYGRGKVCRSRRCPEYGPVWAGDQRQKLFCNLEVLDGEILLSAVTAPRGRRFSKGSHLYYWRAVRTAFGRPEMDFYELRHFCATHLLELGVSHADVAVQLGHTDNGRLVMSTYGHPSEASARERLKRAYAGNVRRLAPVIDVSEKGRGSA